MRPLRKGAARTALAEGLTKLAYAKLDATGQTTWHDLSIEGTPRELADRIAQLQAAVLGGAIEETMREMFPLDDESKRKVMIAEFWRYTNENLWRMTRALEASGLLDKAGE